MWQGCAVTVQKCALFPCHRWNEPIYILSEDRLLLLFLQRYATTPSWSGQHQSKLLVAYLVRGEPGVLTNNHSFSREGVLEKVHFILGLREWSTFVSRRKPLLPQVYANMHDMEDTCYFSECKSWWGIKGGEQWLSCQANTSETSCGKYVFRVHST